MSMRPAGDEDEGWLFELHEAAMRPAVERIYGSWVADDQRTRFDGRSETDVRVVEVDGERAGAVRLAEADDGSLYIGLIEVAPAWQGRGVGTSVIRALDEEAARGGQSLTLRVRHGNPARRLYERLGFVVEREDETHAHMRRS